MIIAIDFDGTCVEHKYPHVGKTLPNVIVVLHRLIANGHQLVLDTMRDWVNPSPTRKYETVMDDAVQWFVNHNIPLLSVQPHQHAKEWTQSTKCHADLSIDDRNVGCPLDSNGHVDWFQIEILLHQKGLI